MRTTCYVTLRHGHEFKSPLRHAEVQSKAPGSLSFAGAARRVIDRINGFADRFAAPRVDITTGVDEHDGFAHYSWQLVDARGSQILDGIDVVDRAPDG